MRHALPALRSLHLSFAAASSQAGRLHFLWSFPTPFGPVCPRGGFSSQFPFSPSAAVFAASQEGSGSIVFFLPLAYLSFAFRFNIGKITDTDVNVALTLASCGACVLRFPRLSRRNGSFLW